MYYVDELAFKLILVGDFRKIVLITYSHKIGGSNANVLVV